MERTLVLDTETTGVSADASIVEIAWIEIDADLNEIRRFRSLIDPEMPISPGASGVHHITNEMVSGEPTMKELLADVIPCYFAPDDEITMIAHNAVFDLRFVKPYLPVIESVCTLRLARYCWPDAPDHKLQTLRYHFGLDGGEGAHGALQDCETTLALTRYMCTSRLLTLQDLRGLCRGKLPVKRAYFGKYKDALITDIPAGYRRWMLGTDIDDDLRASVKASFNQ